MSNSTSHLLPAEHIHYSWDPNLAPVLEIDSGDDVLLDTRVLTEEQVLPGAPPSVIRDIDWARIHALTGPIAIRDAVPGDTLEVQVLALRPSSWGVSWIDPTYGLLMSDFQEPAVRFFDLTREDGHVEFANGILIPLAPFLGVMGVAPRDGQATTYAPGAFGGNLDCKELTVGSRLFLPIFVAGAMFSAGDAHAVQGDGEICSAIECGMTARLRFRVHKERSIAEPRVETPDAVMTIGHGASVEEAAQNAARGMVDYLVETRSLSREDAYLLCSLAGDARINELVNGNPLVFGARYVLPRGVFVDGRDDGEAR